MPERPPVSTIEQPHSSELFTVRLWREQLNDHWEWRGKVQHITTGEVRYFRDWALLIVALQEMVTDAGVHSENTDRTLLKPE